MTNSLMIAKTSAQIVQIKTYLLPFSNRKSHYPVARYRRSKFGDEMKLKNGHFCAEIRPPSGFSAITFAQVVRFRCGLRHRDANKILYNSDEKNRYLEKNLSRPF